MKTGKYITVLSVALLAAAGCSDDKTETVYKPYSTVVEVAADCELPVKFGTGDELYINRVPFSIYTGNQINLHDAAPALEYLLYAPVPNSEEDTRLIYTLPAKQTYVANGVDVKACPIFGITDNDAMNDKIEVRPACGALKLSIPAPEDDGFAAVTSIKLRTYDYVLAGDIALDYTTGAVDWVGAASQAVTLSGNIDISAPKSAKSTESTEGGETPEEPAVHYTEVYFALPPMKIHDNLEVTMISSKGSSTFNIDTKNKVIEQGKVLSVVPSAESIKWVSAKPFYGKTNCVLVAPGTTSVTVDCTPHMTTSLTYAYEFLDGSEEAASAGVLWNDVSPTFITGVQLAANRKSFTATLDGQPGNAVVAIYDNSGTVLWSFHIWVTEHADHDYGNGYTFMDRHLGAVSLDPADGNKAYGFIYQWGRKDPFMYNNWSLYNESGATKLDSPVKSSSSTGTIEYAVAHPMQQINFSKKSPGLWLAAANDALWGNPEGYANPDPKTLRKSVYDPCPEGYMVAPNDAWLKSDKTNSVFSGEGTSGKGLQTVINGHDVYYPYSGLYNGSGSYADQGKDGSTLKSCPLAAKGQAAYAIIKSVNPTVTGKGNRLANCYSVRCVKETAK
ncbi:MAG: hypothetical protein NC250_00460 [Alistipes senegalensis]|nr:hypothetical protein [Bacteroides cellulosilyticus]MCM1351194.1 hypothetical protein [Alistipes senegalensis]